jgi:hypothetical protein
MISKLLIDGAANFLSSTTSTFASSAFLVDFFAGAFLVAVVFSAVASFGAAAFLVVFFAGAFFASFAACFSLIAACQYKQIR